MSKSSKTDQTGLKESETEIMPPSPEVEANSILESLELIAVEKSKNPGLDISSLSEKQIDKLLEMLLKNEDNSFKFHTKRIGDSKELELAKISSREINRKTLGMLPLVF